MIGVIFTLGLGIVIQGIIAGYKRPYVGAGHRVFSVRSANEAMLIGVALVVCLYGDYLLYGLTH